MKLSPSPRSLLVGKLATSAGPFAVACEPTGAAAATAFGDVAAVLRRLEPGVKLIEGSEADRVLAPVIAQLEAFFSGRRRDFEVAMAPKGSAFQLRVWQALREIPIGETRSYGELAKGLGSSARAVGRANATNPICVIVPCHRVIGANGDLTGFAFGVEIKQWLLEIERGEGKMK
jgi:methylated-DNA-[protein]-cysteine S-methyltransferase